MTHRQDRPEVTVDTGSDADLLREMIAFVASRMMELGLRGSPASARRPLAKPHQPAQRLSRADIGDTRRRRAAGDPQAREGQLISVRS